MRPGGAESPPQWTPPHNCEQEARPNGQRLRCIMPTAELDAAIDNHRKGAPWSVPDAAAFLSISAQALEKMLQRGQCRGIKLGRRRLITDAELQRLAQEGTGT